MMNSSLLGRLARVLGSEGALQALERRLPASDLQSLLLHVIATRSARRTEAELFVQYERSAAVRPSAVDARRLAELERLAFEVSPSFEGVELAPIAPLGLNTVLGRIHQNNCLATIRNSEVLADPTTAAALECARRRRVGDRGDIKLCARSRLLRLQPLHVPEHSPHFGLFSWVTAGRDRGDYRFELENVREHIECHLALLRKLPALGYVLGAIAVRLSHTARDERRLQQAEGGVLAPFREAHPEVSFELDREREQGRNYYDGLCLRIDVQTPGGEWFNLSDGGLTAWTQRLLANRKERLMVSAIGLELIPKVFRPATELQGCG